MKRHQSCRGLTLLELAIAIAIVVILATMALPQLAVQIDSAAVSVIGFSTKTSLPASRQSLAMR